MEHSDLLQQKINSESSQTLYKGQKTWPQAWPL